MIPPGRRADPAGRGQSLIEFAVTLPVLILLVTGMLELGRGYAIAVATNDAARDGARIAAGELASGRGPGVAGICSIITADLASLTSSLTCGTAFVAPGSGQATATVNCGATGDCQGTAGTIYHATITVTVYYRFDDLRLVGGGVVISGTSQMTTSW